MQGQLIENVRTVPLIGAVDSTGAARTSAWFALKYGSRCKINIQTGAWAAGTEAVTLGQATNSSGSASAALAFTTYWTNTTTVDVPVKNTATSNTFNLTAANTLYSIEINAYDLTINSATGAATNAYVQLLLASPGGNSDLVSAWVDIYDGPFAALASTQPSVLS